MKITILTLFPQIIEGYFTSSIMAKAVDKGLIEYHIIDFRDFAADKHRTADDYPYGAARVWY
jgi:tRNA (guanine37-N1)-methyltransferase